MEKFWKPWMAVSAQEKKHVSSMLMEEGLWTSSSVDNYISRKIHLFGLTLTLVHFSIWRREEEPMPEECAVKVFKTTLNEFKTRDRYIKDDHRFRDRFSKQNPRKVIRLWAEKEMCNLSRLVSFMWFFSYISINMQCSCNNFFL